MILIPLSPEGRWRALSPDMPAPIQIGQELWPTVTHYFLAHRYFFDPDRRAQIRQAATPAAARALATQPGHADWQRRTLGTDAEPHMYWTRTKRNILRRAIHARAISDPVFVETLQQTAAPDPETDGGVTAQQEAEGPAARLVLDCDEPVLGRPESAWGCLLEELRARLRIVDIDVLRAWKLPAWFQFPEIARGSIGWRMGYGEAYLDELHTWISGLAPDERQRFKKVYGDWPDDTRGR